MQNRKMKINISDLQLRAFVGILPKEKRKKQKVVLDIEIEYLYKKKFINYADVAKKATKIIKKSKNELLEDIVLELHVKLKKTYPKIKKIKIKMTKPQIMKKSIVSVEKTKKY